MHKEVDQSKSIVRHAVTNDMNKRVNSSVGKEPLFKKTRVKKISPTVEIATYADNDSIYLRLKGSEEECLFSSTAPETKSTVNVS